MSYIINRRDFIKNLAAISVPFGLSASAISSAQSYLKKDHFFVILNIWGAMDVTLSMDPWLDARLPDPTDMFIEYKISDVLELDTGVKVGPALSFLNKHAYDSTIVNGVFMSENDVGHEILREYMITGSLKGFASSFALEVSSHFGQKGLGSIIDSTKFPTGSHLVTALEDLKNMSSIDSRILEIASLVPKNDPFSFVKSILEAPKSISLIESFIDYKDKFSDQKGISEAYLVAAGFLSGSSMSAEIDFEDFDLGPNNLDTHSDHPINHFERQMKAWDIVDDFFSTFKKIPYGENGKSLFDHTTFMVSNEFSRTPYLNSSNGKDHNPLTNSLLFAGKGIRGGQVIGGSRLVSSADSPTGKAYHIALPIDYQTGKTTQYLQPQSHMIFPENIIATLCELFSVKKSAHPSLMSDSRAILPLLKI